MSENSIMNTFGQMSVSFESGDGVWLYDTDGNKYFDTFFGIAVSSLGHANAAITKAVKDQAGRLMHCSNFYRNPLQEKLAHSLCEISNMEKVFFCNSGAEANEAAIKIAQRYANERGIPNPKVIVMDNAFHGRTMATLSASANAKLGVTPLMEGFLRAPYNDIDVVTELFSTHNDIVAVMLEPIQGEGGIHIAQINYLKALRTLCDEQNALLILDEVQTGNGRTGKYFAHEHANIHPDVVTAAKGLANGFPIGACLARGPAASILIPSSHGITFGGNPLACAAALAVIEQITEHNLIKRAELTGAHILHRLKDELGSADYVKRIEGKGLMIGIELSEPCFALVALAKAKGILLNVTSNNVIRLLPPLNISDEESEFLIEACVQIIRLYAADDRSKPRD